MEHRSPLPARFAIRHRRRPRKPRRSTASPDRPPRPTGRCSSPCGRVPSRLDGPPPHRTAHGRRALGAPAYRSIAGHWTQHPPPSARAGASRRHPRSRDRRLVRPAWARRRFDSAHNAYRRADPHRRAARAETPSDADRLRLRRRTPQDSRAPDPGRGHLPVGRAAPPQRAPTRAPGPLAHRPTDAHPRTPSAARRPPQAGG